ncbi:SusC/RagA family TonB-linked outer membrane protein [Parapedobacter sp. 2B3]|uniref:SusC/RagA family TonB-linked outer membrane protein n=1 Tax=Parapedobacter sp. 2B3 TaxID=3342381 RepID=UPI0035B5FA0D
MCLYARAQQQETFTVAGKVISAASGVAIEGATITNKRTRIHAFTDRSGDYRIPARPDDILVYSFVGYVTSEQEIGGREKIIVALDSAENTLEEVEINAGYYTTTRRTSTGNISRVTAEEIERQPVNSPLAAMAGRLPGVQVIQESGYAGSSYTVQVRGQNSLRDDGNDPLYVVNGVPFPSVPLTQLNGVVRFSSPLNNISTADIASIDVLKDADATAIYGSRGANGVILITTKQGKQQAGAISIVANSGWSTVPRKIELLSREQYLTMRREAFANDQVNPTISNAPDLMLWDTTRYTDWQEVLLGGTAHQSSVSTSLSGSAASIRYYIGSSYFRETSVIPGDLAYNKGSASSSLSYQGPDRRFNIQAGFTYSLSNNQLPRENMAVMATRLPPVAPEPYIGSQLNWANGTWDNPFVYLERSHELKTSNILANALLDYELFPRLSLRLAVSYSHMGTDEIQLNPANTYNPSAGVPPKNSSFFADNTEYGINAEPQILYHHSIGKGNMQYLLGTSFQENRRQGHQLNAIGFSASALMEQLSSAEELTGSTSYSQYRYNAVFGRVAYNLKDTYLLNLTFRRDGSSRFGPGKQWGNFGAIGGAWLFSEEPYLKNRLPFLSLGKIRASYGITGSDQIGNYGYLDTYRPAYSYMNPGLVTSRLANAAYGWEENRKAEIALETGFLQNRLQFSISYFRNRSSNQLIEYQLPTMTGFASVQSNFDATVQNTGAELEIRSLNIKIGQFSWSSYAQLTLPRNKLIAFPNIENTSYTQLVVGQPIQFSRGYLLTGVNPETGAYLITDIDENGSISATADRVVLKRPIQLFGGIENTLSLGSISLNFFLQVTRKTGFEPWASFGMPGILRNQPVEVMARWQQRGDHGTVAKFSRGSTTDFTRYASSNAVFNNNASFIGLRNASLVWQLSDKWLKPIKIRQAAIQLQGQNLSRFTKYIGLDPEASTSPILRTIVLGINLTI